MNKVHFIAMAGMAGCLPNVVQGPYDTVNAAADALAALHGLTAKQERTLRRNRYLALDLATYGNEYAEVQECTCADPDSHSE